MNTFVIAQQAQRRGGVTLLAYNSEIQVEALPCQRPLLDQACKHAGGEGQQCGRRGPRGALSPGLW